MSRTAIDWSRCGAGWEIHSHPVALEAPWPHVQHPVVDDAQHETGLSALWARLRGRGAVVQAPAPPLPAILPDPYPRLVHAFQVRLAPGWSPSRDEAEQLLVSLSHTDGPVSFELVGSADAVTVQVATRASFPAQVRQQLGSSAPGALLSEGDVLSTAWRSAGPARLVVDFGLAQSWAIPLRTMRSFEPDSLLPIIAAFSSLAAFECAAFQVLFMRARHPWGDWLREVATVEAGARQKASRPLFAVVVRAAAAAAERTRSLQLLRVLTASLAQFASPLGNELIALENSGYPLADREQSLLARSSNRTGMLLNAEELAGLAHFPSASIDSPKLLRRTVRTKAAPAITRGHAFVLGENVHDDLAVPVSLPPELRMQHTYIVGATGTGKTTFLTSAIVQDIEAGHGVAVLDPHGDLITEVLRRIPAARVADTVLFDPADEEYPIGMNVLHARSELERTLLASDLVATFRRFSQPWGEVMSAILSYGVLAILEREGGGTLLDLRRMLVEPKFRTHFLRGVRDPEVVSFFEREYRPNAAGPLLTRLSMFLRNKLIRRIVGQPENRLDFRAMMDERRIFLGRLSAGAIGVENAHLLGSLIVTSMNQAALSRQEQEVSARRPFFLYMDEFHYFVTPSIADLLSGVRKYGMGLTVAHQALTQVAARDAEVAALALIGPATRIVFRTGEADARRLAEGFSYFTATDVQNLGVGEAIARVEKASNDFNLNVTPAPAPGPEAEERRAAIIGHSRARFGRTRAEVDALLAPAEGQGETASEPPQPPLSRPALPLAEPAAPRPAPRRAPAPAVPGRGGAQHKYLQALIKQIGESHGYRATVERQTEDGSIDVALENDARKIACEISVTTEAAYEVDNVRKRLAGGFTHAVMISSDSRQRDRLAAALAALPADEQARVRVLAPEELPVFLGELDATAASREDRVGGYKVKTRFVPVEAAEKEARKRSIGETIAESLKRLGKRKE